MKHIIKPNKTIILNAVGSVLNIRHLLNLAVLTLLFLSKLPNQNTCIYTSLKNKYKLYKFNIINFWYQMFFRNEKACLYYLTSINLIWSWLFWLHQVLLTQGQHHQIDPWRYFITMFKALLTLEILIQIHQTSIWLKYMNFMAIFSLINLI